MKKVLIALVLIAVMAFGAGVTSAAELKPEVSYKLMVDPGGGVKP